MNNLMERVEYECDTVIRGQEESEETGGVGAHDVFEGFLTPTVPSSIQP